MEPGRRASLWLLVGLGAYGAGKKGFIMVPGSLGAYGAGKKGFIMAPGRPRYLWSWEEGLHYGSW